MSKPIPKYRKHRASGLAVVTLNHKDHYLGPYRSKASLLEYDRLIAEWLANSRRLPGDPAESFTINELIVGYWEHCQRHYVKNGKPTDEQHCIKSALRFVRQLYGNTQATEFNPLALKASRQKMIDAGWVRTSINTHVGRIRRMFKWGAEHELVPTQIWVNLQTVNGLQRGRSEACEAEPIKPVPEPFVTAIKPYVSRQVWAMIQLQQLSGMRPGEVVILRGCDIDMTGKVWIFNPESHKTEHRGRQRQVFLGPQAQNVVLPFLRTELQAYLFSPRDAEAERRAIQREKRQSTVQPSQRDRRKSCPKRQACEHYTTDSYRQAIARGIVKANKQGVELPHWHPNQLRHNAGTAARREGGVELAQIILGHSKADVTQVYAERDVQRAIEFVAKHG